MKSKITFKSFLSNPVYSTRYVIQGVIEKMVRKYAVMGTPFFYSLEQFPWVKEIERNWKTIRVELDRILLEKTIPNFQEISKEQLSLTQDDKWKTFFLYVYGHEIKDNCQSCPETARLIKQIPHMKTALFSILYPRKHLPEHRGAYNGVLRYHLGLIVPKEKEKCRMRVGSEVQHWEEGNSLVFDDCWRHEVWNDTDEMRVILLVDIERPVHFPASIINKMYLKIFGHMASVREIRENLIHQHK